MAHAAQPGFAGLTQGQNLNGFTAQAVYLDDSDRAIGARFKHARSGFTLDLLGIQSVPQAFIYVTTYPTSDMGEPHTQEHLLLGKGDKGRDLANREPMALVNSSAYTQQWRTCYFFYTPAGADPFFQHFEHTMDALLHPDYSDEEIRREVRNFGVSADPPGGPLRLEEKGTVYAEMVTSMDQANNRLYHSAGVTLYGSRHPLAFNSGGLPAALRVLQPADIRKFHAEHYFLGNMGAIVSLPKEVSLDTALSRLDGELNRLQPNKPSYPVVTEDQLPAPGPAPAGRIQFVEYPFRNNQQPGTAMLLWPADRKLSVRDETLLSLFLGNVAGGADTNLYKLLIDSRTRKSDIGAKNVRASVDTDLGHPVYVILQDVPAARMTEKDMSELRTQVIGEFAAIAAYPDGSPELKEFNDRLRGRIVEEQRSLSRFVNSPPGFGYRDTSSAWVDQLTELNKEPGFRKSLTEKEDMAAIQAMLGSGRNIWRDLLREWKITGVAPYVEAAKPSPALLRESQVEKEARLAAEVERLKRQYGVGTEQEALKRYSTEYETATAELEQAAAKGAPPKFIDSPPMTLDDLLDYKMTKLAGGVPLVASTFDSMTSATAGVSLRLDAIPEDQLVFVSLLPQLLTRAGVIENGKPVPYEQMTQRLRNEILELSAYFSINPTANRYELTVRGAGNNLAESQRAVEWMKLALFHPDWRPENLPRLRDLVDQLLGNLRSTMQSREENWVNDPALAWRMQDNPALLATGSFLTRTHNAFRLRWMLKEGGTPKVYGLLRDLAGVSGGREQRNAVLASIRDGAYKPLETLGSPERAIVQEAARDLNVMLPDIPDSSLAADWRYLCEEIARDLEFGPVKALAALDSVRQALLKTGGARLFLVGATPNQKQLETSLQSLVEGLANSPVKPVTYAPTQRIAARVLAREPGAAEPLFVGLLNANSQGGVFLNSAPNTGYRDTDRGKLLDYLASNLYSGHGAHGVFMKTWAAGLAYSNGLRVRPVEARLNYYAERTPELPQTLQFVINELKRAKADPGLVDYSIALAFDGSRSAASYEDRAEAMAADLADGLTPDIVRRFRSSILQLRKDPNLTSALFGRMNTVYGKVLPGMNVKARDVKSGVYFVIGPEQQISAWETYLKRSDDPGDTVFRLYPRDFWMQ